jgi:hypothetical protein
MTEGHLTNNRYLRVEEAVELARGWMQQLHMMALGVNKNKLVESAAIAKFNLNQIIDELSQQLQVDLRVELDIEHQITPEQMQ